jgi:hypothetical protein
MISAAKSSDTARSTDAIEFRAAGKGRDCKTKGDREMEEGEDAENGVVRCGRAKGEVFVKRGGDAPHAAQSTVRDERRHRDAEYGV